MFCGWSAHADTLKLNDAPLSQVIELYSRETGQNVFVDDTVQQQRKVTAHLQGMPICEAFAIIQKTLGLESNLVGTGTMLLYPPERASRYRAQARPLVIRLPLGIEAKWVVTALQTLLPGVRVTPAANDERALLLFGPDTAVSDAREIVQTFPSLAQSHDSLVITENEAKLAVREVDALGVRAEAGPGGLVWQGAPDLVRGYGKRVHAWRQHMTWGSDVFTPAILDAGRAIKAAEAIKGRATVADLGGTGAVLIEGPKAERERVVGILRALDQQQKQVQREVLLGDLTPQAAKDALKSANVSVQSAGDRRLVLVGKESAVVDATSLITALGTKRRQVTICLRLAEVARARLKTLGIDLDKNVYGYGEIKGYHPSDSLPLLLKLMNQDQGSRILAQPNLQVLEGEEAKVLIGDRIPLEVAATAQTDSGSLLKLNTQLSWAEVGIKLTVKGVQVNQAGEIRMGLTSEVSTVVATTKQGYPQIRTREAGSCLRVPNGGAVVMGGLISQEERETASKIPVIGNIPLFGGLARGRDRQKNDTEIVMVVTAKVIEE